MSHHQSPTFLSRLQEFSIPLLAGVVVALVVVNVNEPLYHKLTHEPLHEVAWSFVTGAESATDHVSHHEPESKSVAQTTSNQAHHEVDSHHGPSAESEGADHTVAHAATNPQHSESLAHYPLDENHSAGHNIFSMAFIINDLFMVFFFGIAAKEITEACLPGGSLNPPSKAINPLLGTLGGVLGPIAVFLSLNWIAGQPEWARGWGIPTATDIALAWLVARLLFGKGHPAISFLLLLAIADDAIGLGIIAFAYPDPLHPVQWFNTVWIVPGLLVAACLRWRQVSSWLPYVLIGGGFCWWGLYSAHLHPALALVFVVPFIPGPKRDTGLYSEPAKGLALSPLEKFEHDIKLSVDFGLFFFAFANAGVTFAGINNLTWIILASLIIGKTVGITLFSLAGAKLGFPLPEGLGVRHLLVTGNIAGLGLTVALFVSNQAYMDPGLQGAAKMGACSVSLPLVSRFCSSVIRVAGQVTCLDATSHSGNVLPSKSILGIPQITNRLLTERFE
ncbi:MAG: Na+/H+ antiporter NhaA [Pirellulaceae bacterium]